MKIPQPSLSEADRPHMLRRGAAEFLGSALLVTIVVGSGIAAQRLSPSDVGLQLLENSLTTAFGLTVLILMLGPVSGAHFNPVVTIADWLLGRRAGTGLPLRDVTPYVLAQVSGGIAGPSWRGSCSTRALRSHRTTVQRAGTWSGRRSPPQVSCC